MSGANAPLAMYKWIEKVLWILFVCLRFFLAPAFVCSSKFAHFAAAPSLIGTPRTVLQCTRRNKNCVPKKLNFEKLTENGNIACSSIYLRSHNTQQFQFIHMPFFLLSINHMASCVFGNERHSNKNIFSTRCKWEKKSEESGQLAAP